MHFGTLELKQIVVYLDADIFRAKVSVVKALKNFYLDFLSRPAALNVLAKVGADHRC